MTDFKKSMEMNMSYGILTKLSYPPALLFIDVS